MNEREKLYDNLPIISLEELNREAHPGGGPTIRAADLGEGLVEDLYEAQLRAVDIARPEDIVAVAHLASALDRAGFVKYAIEADKIVDGLTALGGGEVSEPFMDQESALEEIHGLIEEARMELLWLENNLSVKPRHTMEAFEPIQTAQHDLWETAKAGGAVTIAEVQPILRNLSKAVITILSDRFLHPTSKQTQSALTEEDSQHAGNFMDLLKKLRVETFTVLKSLRKKTTPQREVTPSGKVAPAIGKLIGRAKQINKNIDALDKEMAGLIAIDPSMEDKLTAILEKVDIPALVAFADRVVPALQRGASGEGYDARLLTLADAALKRVEKTLSDLKSQIYQ